MKRLSFIPEIFIWLTFSVVAGFGYAFSFFEYVNGHAQMSVADIIIPTLVWILLAAICTFLLRIAQNTQCFMRFSKAESVFLECSVLSLLLIGGWVFRFVDYFQSVWPAGLDNTYFEFAQVSQNAVVYMNPHPASRLYVGFLHIVCLFLGNIYEAGAMIQFVLLLLAVLVWYFAIRKAFGAIAALFFVAGAMLLPDSIVASMQCNPMMLLFFIYGCIALMIVHYAHSRRVGFFMTLGEILLGALVMAAVFLDISGCLMVLLFGLALRYRKKNCIKKPFLTPLPACFGIMSGCGVIPLLQARIYDMNFVEAAKFMAYTHLSLQLPDISTLQGFVFSLGTHPVFIVAIVVISIYWFLNKKQAFTWIMLSILFLFGIQLLQMDVFLQHDFMIYMGISVLLGISVQQYLSLADKQAPGDEHDAYVAGTPEIVELKSDKTQTEPVVTVIRFEEEPAVTVPEKQQDKPLIFIPKSMEIPKRVSKPKVDFAIEVEAEKLHFDYAVDDAADFDIV